MTITRYAILPPKCVCEQYPLPKRPEFPQFNYINQNNDIEDCVHQFEIRQKTSSNGTIVLREQCVLCGHGGVVRKRDSLTPEEFKHAPLYDFGAAENYWTERRNRGQTEKQIENDKIAAAYKQALITYDQQYNEVKNQRSLAKLTAKQEWNAWYQTYLESDVWQAKRLAVLRRENWRCQACRDAMATIAHHLHYRNVGAEPLFDLVAVCKSCHADLHGYNEDFDLRELDIQPTMFGQES